MRNRRRPEASATNIAVLDAPGPSRRGEEMTFDREVVSPQVATLMLKTALDPRRDEQAIKVYADAMRHKTWILNGQPIIFDESGALIDGVQRLQACVRADISFITLVARNVRADTLHTIDQHRRRNYTGVLESRGYRHAGALVRTMKKMIHIQNGALNRGPLPISWSRFDRVLERNPELAEAVDMAQEYQGSLLHFSPRPVFFFMAIRTGRTAELRQFMKELSPDRRPDRITAATQAQMRLGGWSKDPFLKVDPDKILGNVIDYFNAFCKGEILPDNHIWNPDFGKVRNANGKWIAAQRPVRFDRAENLSLGDMRMVRGEEAATTDELKKIAGKLLQMQPRRITGDSAFDEITPHRLHPRLDNEAFKKFLTPGETLRERLEKEMERRLLEKAAPGNLGLPIVEGYLGLRGAGFKRDGEVEAFVGETSKNSSGDARFSQDAVTARMITITPELAEAWLSKRVNSNNRKIQRSHIKAIARDIAHARWMVNAQPICFSADPFDPASNSKLRLLNGQHRLAAVVEAGLPIEAPVAINIAEEAFATFDIRAKRTIPVAANRVDSRVLAAAARFQWKEDNNYDLMEISMSPTASELMETIARHPGLAEHFARSRRAGMAKIGSAGVLTYLFYRISRDQPDAARQFLDALELGENLTSRNPVKELRDALLSGAKTTRKQVLSRLITGWNAYKLWQSTEDFRDLRSSRPSPGIDDNVVGPTLRFE